MSDEKKSPGDMKHAERSGAVKGELSSLWQSALGQIDEIRDVIVRGSQAGKAKLDAQLLKRQRDKLLQQIGEAVLNDAKSGAIQLPPSCDELSKRLDDVDRQLKEAEAEADKAFARVKPSSGT